MGHGEAAFAHQTVRVGLRNTILGLVTLVVGATPGGGCRGSAARSAKPRIDPVVEAPDPLREPRCPPGPGLEVDTLSCTRQGVRALEAGGLERGVALLHAACNEGSRPACFRWAELIMRGRVEGTSRAFGLEVARQGCSVECPACCLLWARGATTRSEHREAVEASRRVCTQLEAFGEAGLGDAAADEDRPCTAWTVKQPDPAGPQLSSRPIPDLMRELVEQARTGCRQGCRALARVVLDGIHGVSFRLDPVRGIGILQTACRGTPTRYVGHGQCMDELREPSLEALATAGETVLCELFGEGDAASCAALLRLSEDPELGSFVPIDDALSVPCVHRQEDLACHAWKANRMGACDEGEVQACVELLTLGPGPDDETIARSRAACLSRCERGDYVGCRCLSELPEGVRGSREAEVLREQVAVLLDRVRQDWRRGAYTEAVDHLVRAVWLRRDDPALLGELGYASFLAGEHVAARKITARALELARGDRLRALLRDNLRRIAESRAGAERAPRPSP